MFPDSRETSYRIETATEGDWPWITQGQVETIWVKLSSQHQQVINRQTIEEYVERQIATLRKDEGFPSQVFIAKTYDGKPAGYVWVAKDHNDSTGELEAILLNQYVAEPYRGQGLGHRLLETAEEWARGQGLPRISLSVGVQNRIGQGLYKSLGYQVETLRMAKELGPGEPADFLLADD